MRISGWDVERRGRFSFVLWVLGSDGGRRGGREGLVRHLGVGNLPVLSISSYLIGYPGMSGVQLTIRQMFGIIVPTERFHIANKVSASESSGVDFRREKNRIKMRR